jgi:hypothetical protein
VGGVKVTNFMGIAPKISPELLPDTAAQVARNSKLYSGDLIPYTNAVVKTNTLRNGICRTIHALREPGTNALKWLSWLSDVEIVVATPDNDQDLDQRYYYTGDGVPKVSNYELSFGGPAPYPYRWYDLGLPLPPDSQVLTAVAEDAITSETVQFSRDNANTATIITNVTHNLRTGSQVTITGFTYRSGTYSQSGSTITVTILAHGLEVGAQVTLNFKTGDSIDGTFSVVSVTSENVFTVTAGDSGSHSGNVDWDIRNFNVTNGEVTVLNSTEFTYFSPGPAVAVTSYTQGRVSLAGNTQERKYVFTWYTPWEEESIASKPSEALYIKEGQLVTISGIPFQKPDGNNYIRGVNLYRTLPTAVETEYYLLQTLWFPVPLDVVSRTAGVVTLSTYYPHNLDPEDRFRLAYCTNSTFDGDFEVVDVIDQYTFTYTQAGADVADTIVSGYVYHDIAEDPVAGDPARYWGYYSYDVLDDYDSKALTTILTTDEYDPPPEGLRGLVVIQNNILAGYVGNTLYFSEPKVPHAWPKEYATVLEYNVIGLSVLNGALVVLTDGYPYTVATSDPAAGISVSKIDALFPCIASRGIVKLANMVAYPTNDGLAIYSPFGGSQLITKVNYNDDTWKADFDPRTIIAGYYNEAYFASYGNAAQVGAAPEPTLPTFSVPALPPEPLGGPIDGTDGSDPGDPGTPTGPPADDPTLLYDGEILAGYIKLANAQYLYGYNATGSPMFSGATVGSAQPSALTDGVRQLVTVACSRQPAGRAYYIKTYITISGYTADPSSTPEFPVTFRVGTKQVNASSRDNYSYSAGAAIWRWDSDKFGLSDKDGKIFEVEIRKAP